MAAVTLIATGCVEDGPPPTTSSSSTSSTTEPTDTTDPSDTSSTTDPVDTTTTIDPTDPTDPPEEVGPEFAFDEPVVMFTDEGGSIDLRLAEYEGGEETDTEVPAEVIYEILGDTDAFDVRDLEDGGGLRVSSDGTVGGIVIAARIPGQPLATVTEVFTAVPNEGVDVIDTNRVVFPPASLPHGMKLADYRDGDGLVTGSAVGPFTWQELVDRVSIPDGVNVEHEPDAGAVLDPDPIETPFVIRGTAPADGTLVLSGGANGMSGRVIASTTRMHDGVAYSLLTVQVASLDDLYADLSWNPDEFDVDLVTSDMTEEELDIAILDRESPLVRAGVIPQSYGFELSCSDPEVSLSDCDNDDLVDHSTMTVVAADGTTGDFGRSVSAGSGRVHPMERVQSRQGPTSTVVDDGPGGPDGPPAQGQEEKTKCSPEISAAIKDLSGPKPVHKMYPKPVFSIFLSDKPEDWAREHVYVTNGYVQSASFEFSGTLRASLAASMGCSKVLGFIPVPVPMGPMTGILMFGVQAQAILDVGVAIEGGPSLEMGLKCSMSHRVSVGFKATTASGGERLRHIDPILVNTLDRDCTPRWDAKLGFNNQGIAAKVDMSAYIGFKFLLGFQVNQFLGVGLWAEILDFPNQGFFDLASVDVGPKAILTVETPARVLDNDASETRAAIDVKVTGKLGSSAIERIAKGVGLKSSDITSSFQTTFLDLTLPVIALYEPINAVPNGMQITVDGDAQSGTAEVRKGQRIGVRSLMAAAGPALNQEIRDAELYVVRNLPLGLEVMYDKLDGVSLTGNGMSIDDGFTVTEAHCDVIGTDAVDVVVLANGIVFRTAEFEMDAASFGGRFRIRCMQPELKFSADRVDFASDELHSPKSIDLKATMLGGETWSVTDKPAWLNVSPTTGTPPADRDETTIGMGLGVQCPIGEPNKYNGTVTVSSDIPGETGTITASFDVSVDCRTVYLDATPKEFSIGYQGGPVSFTVTTAGPHPVYISQAPRPDENPDKIFYKERETYTFTIHVDPRPRTCKVGQKLTKNFSFVSWPVLEEHQYGRGNFTIVVRQDAAPKLPADECDPPAGSGGDPHIRTFGGDGYDAQTLGEYWYVKPGPEGPDVEVQVRNEVYHANATVATAAAARVNGHTFEWYRRSDIAPHTKVLIDGEQVMVEHGAVQQFDGDVSFVASHPTGAIGTAWPPNSTWTIRAAGFTMTVTASNDLRTGRSPDDLVIRIYMDRGADVNGVLGSPDGDRSNDFTTADGAASYTLKNIRQHGTELLDLWGSWRVTDLDDSLFSETYAGFDQTISLFNPLDLAEKRAYAEDYMSHFDVICEMPTGDEYSYAMDRLAIELLAGSGTEVLDDNTCSYVVEGVVTTDIPGSGVVPVPGLHVNMTGDRLRDCSTTTDTYGSYHCRLIPLGADDLPETGIPPVEVSLTGSWRAGGPVITSATVAFDEFGLLGGTDSVLQQDLVVDRSELVGVELSGTLTADLDGYGPAPVNDSTAVTISAFDDEGNRIGTFNDWAVPDDDGEYTLVRYLSGHTETVEVQYRMGSILGDRPVLTHQVQAGANPLDGDIAFQPPLAVVTGTLVDGDGEPLPGTRIRATSFANGQSVDSAFTHVRPDATGSYRGVVQLPMTGVDSFVATVEIGVTTTDWVETSFTGEVSPGANEVVLSAVYDPPIISVTGSVLDRDGAPYFEAGKRIVMDITSYDVNGHAIIDQATMIDFDDEGNSTFELGLALPTTAVRVELRLRVGVATSDWPILVVDDLERGVNEIVFDHVHAPPLLRLDGVLLDGAGNARPDTRVAISAFDSDDSFMAVVTTFATPDEAGAYDTGPVELPHGTRRAQVTYELGVSQSDHRTFEIDPIDPDLTERTFDIDQRYVTLAVEGLALGKGGFPLSAVSFQVAAYDVDDNHLASYTNAVIPRGESGWYTFTRQVPDLTDHVVLTAVIGGGYIIDRPTMLVEDLGHGLNQAVFDVTHIPTIVRVTGTMYGLDVGTGLPGPLAVTTALDFQAYDADGTLLHNGASPIFNLDSVNGNYYVDIPVPNDTDSVMLTDRFGSGHIGVDDKVNVLVEGVTYGEITNAVLDDHYMPPIINAYGNVKIGGVPYSGVMRVGGTTTGADGRTVSIPTSTFSFNPDSNGDFIFRRALLRDSVSATLNFYPASATGKVTTVVLEDLGSGFVDVPLDIDIDDFEVSMYGTLVFFDEPYTDPLPAVLHSFDVNGDEIEARQVVLNPSDGTVGDEGYFNETFGLVSGTRSVGISFEYVDDDSGVVVPFSYGPKNVNAGVPNNFGSIVGTNGSYVTVDVEFTHDGDPYQGTVGVRPVALYGEDMEDSGRWLSSDEVVTDQDGRATVAVFVTELDNSDGALRAIDFELTDEDGHVVQYRAAAADFDEVVREDCWDWEWDEDLDDYVCIEPYVWTEERGNASIHTDEASLDFVSVSREVIVRGDVGDTVEFGFYRIPYNGSIDPGEDDHGYNDLGGEVAQGTWDATEGGYRFTLRMSPMATHVMVTATDVGDPSDVVINHVVPIPEAGPVVVHKTTGPIRLTVSGRSATTDAQADFGVPGCGFWGDWDMDFAGISKARIFLGSGTPPPPMPVWEPGDDWTEYWNANEAWLNWSPDPAESVVVTDGVWVVVDENGEYVLPFDVDITGHEWMVVELSNDVFATGGIGGGNAQSNTVRETFDLADFTGRTSIEVTVDNRPTCVYPM